MYCIKTVSDLPFTERSTNNKSSTKRQILKYIILLSFIINHIILFSWPKISELTHQLVDTFELVITPI